MVTNLACSTVIPAYGQVPEHDRASDLLYTWLLRHRASLPSTDMASKRWRWRSLVLAEQTTQHKSSCSHFGHVRHSLSYAIPWPESQINNVVWEKLVVGYDMTLILLVLPLSPLEHFGYILQWNDILTPLHSLFKITYNQLHKVQFTV